MYTPVSSNLPTESSPFPMYVKHVEINPSGAKHNSPPDVASQYDVFHGLIFVLFPKKFSTYPIHGETTLLIKLSLFP